MPRICSLKPLIALHIACTVALIATPAFAARHPRIEDAYIGEKNRVLLEYGQDAYDETAALASGRDVATFFSFGYNVNERLQVRGILLGNDLSGLDVLYNPLFSKLTAADGWGVEFRMMLERVPPTLPATPDASFTPGNAFTVALGFSSLGLEAPGTDNDLHQFSGRLLYSTDFTRELHAHTMFGTEHYTSDIKRGNATSLGLGVDYDIYTWDDERSALQLTANGLIDIYSIRKPTFDTGRVTRFDTGLRVKVGNSLNGYVGYQVVNDSLSDRNSQGPFYGIAYTPFLRLHTRAHPPAEQPAEEEPPAEPEPALEESPPEDVSSASNQVGNAEEPGTDSGEAPPAESGDKGVSALNPPANEHSGVPSVEILRNVPSDPSLGGANASPAQPWPTTTSRIARPPAIENPWELLPIGYDFHPQTVSVREAVSSPQDPSLPRSATRKLELSKYTSGGFQVFTNLD
ncbi:MAG: hypothetical protein A2Y63_00895 [Candidatus Riflebacteria bacterium RBG_13_59_9]|nr:MAG: hypothetical protein A2Y63_00895 [Candidatus Riflebacteria bacterium RBG_13_59_9]